MRSEVIAVSCRGGVFTDSWMQSRFLSPTYELTKSMKRQTKRLLSTHVNTSGPPKCRQGAHGVASADATAAMPLTATPLTAEPAAAEPAAAPDAVAATAGAAKVT